MNKLLKMKLRALGYKRIHVVRDSDISLAYTNGSNTIFDFKEGLCRTEIKLNEAFTMLLVMDDDECKEVGCKVLTSDGVGRMYINIGDFISKKMPHYFDDKIIVFRVDREYAVYLRKNNETIILKDMNPTICDFRSYLNRGDFCEDKVRAFCNKNNFLEESKFRGNYIKGLYLFEKE